MPELINQRMKGLIAEIGKRVKGIVTLAPARWSLAYRLERDRIPLIFLGYEGENS